MPPRTSTWGLERIREGKDPRERIKTLGIWEPDKDPVEIHMEEKQGNTDKS